MKILGRSTILLEIEVRISESNRAVPEGLRNITADWWNHQELDHIISFTDADEPLVMVKLLVERMQGNGYQPPIVNMNHC